MANEDKANVLAGMWEGKKEGESIGMRESGDHHKRDGQVLPFRAGDR